MSELINNFILPNRGLLYLIGAIIFVFSWMYDVYREGIKPQEQEVRQ